MHYISNTLFILRDILNPTIFKHLMHDLIIQNKINLGLHPNSRTMILDINRGLISSNKFSAWLRQWLVQLQPSDVA